MFQCVILKGLCQREFDNCCTSPALGCSTIDYDPAILCSGDFVRSFNTVFSYLDSNHLPVGITLKMHN